MKKYISLRRCLFDSFANRSMYDFEKDRSLWAILEGLRRLGTWATPVNKIKARKDHTCIRNCTIKAGATYFTDESVIEVKHAALPKVCAGCMAMILYFKDVDNLAPTKYTHWADEIKAAVKIEKEKHVGLS